MGPAGEQVLAGPAPTGAGVGRGVVEAASAAGVGPGGGGLETRHSRRLAAKDAASITDKAIARKASRDDLGRFEGKGSFYLNRKKVQARSGKCGVLLTEGETNSLLEFVAHKV